MTDAERTIRSYLARSAGNCNHVTDHTVQCFVGMVQTGEATLNDFRRIAGDSMVERMVRLAKERGWGEVSAELWGRR